MCIRLQSFDPVTLPYGWIRAGSCKALYHDPKLNIYRLTCVPILATSGEYLSNM
jgi:hypothetical protein